MAELDYEYLDRLLKKAKEDDSDALAELYAATYRKQYRYACQYIEDPFLAQDILQDVYICAFENIESLDDSRCLVSWLEEINGRICHEASLQDHVSSQSRRSRIPDLEPQAAGELLNHVFARRYMEPSTIPVEILESWENYKKPGFRWEKAAACIFLILLLLLPFLFLKPSIVAERKNVDSASNALYDIRIQSLLPVRSVSATLDNSTPVPLRKSGFKKYTAEIISNGKLKIKAVSMNGQTTVKTYTVSHLDMDKPEFIKSYTQDDLIYLVVQDTYSGIDYGNIRGLKPESYDIEEGIITFRIPKTPTSVIIPDHAGNELKLLVSPIEE